MRVTPVSLAITSAASWGSGQTCGLLCNAPGAGAIANIPVALQVPLPLTIAVGFRPLAAPSVSCPIFGAFTGASARIYSLEYDSGGNFPALNVNGTNIAGATGLTAGTDYVLSATVASGTQTLYLNGKSIATGTVSFAPSYTGSQIYVGAVSAFASRTPNALVYWAAWWSGSLSAAQHATIGAHPSSIFQIFNNPIIKAALAAQGSATIPGGGIEFILWTYQNSTTAANYRRRRRMQG